MIGYGCGYELETHDIYVYLSMLYDGFCWKKKCVIC